MTFASTVFLLLFSFVASADDWATCDSNNYCPESEEIRCNRNSDCPEGSTCPRCWGEHCFICTKKPTVTDGCPAGSILQCRPVWREPGVECSCKSQLILDVLQ